MLARTLLLVALLATGSLQTVVEEELIRRPYLDAGWVRVRVEGGTATVSGRVPDALLRAVVLETVRNVRGIRSVKDRLELDPSLEEWKPTRVERTRILLENARRAVKADPVLGVFTTLHVARSRRGLHVTGKVSSDEERSALRRLVEVAPDLGVALDVQVDPAASRRAEALAATDSATVAFASSVTEAIDRERLLRGLVSVRASVERGVLVLRGTAASLPAHDLAVELARAKLIARQREAARTAARSGPLSALLAGEPEPEAGTLPADVETLIRVE